MHFMPCLVGFLALLFPRVVLVLLFLFDTAWLTGAFQTAFWPILGFILMPLTTLAYAWAWHLGGGTISGIGIVIIVIGVLIDLGMLGGGGKSARGRGRSSTSAQGS